MKGRCVKPMKPRELRKRLKQRGFVLDRTTKHEQWKHPETGDIFSIPQGGSEDRNPRSEGRLRAMLRRFDRGRPVQNERKK